jgi:hypothetical protein
MTAIGPRPAEERAVVASVVYASLFEYPLTLAQLRETLIDVSADEDTLAEWYRSSACLQAVVEHREGYYFPRGRGDLLATRAAREALSRKLLGEAHGLLALVRGMPFVRMVAISGSLAHLNAEREADLDLFVVTGPGRVWSVTLSTLVLARLLGWRSRLCLNYVVSERALAVEPADLFSANQILHLQPLAGGPVYRRFLDANPFVARRYPGFRGRDIPGSLPAWPRVRSAVERLLDWTVAPLFERLCRHVYGLHLRRRARTWQTRDQVRLEPECLKLHTCSHRQEVLDRFARALADAEAALDAARGEEWRPARAVR